MFFLIFFSLVHRGANLNVRDSDGCCVLDIAARYGQPEYMETLVKKYVEEGKEMRERNRMEGGERGG